MAKDRWVKVERNLYERHRDGEFVGYYVRAVRQGVVLKRSVGTKIRKARTLRDQFIADADAAAAAEAGEIRELSLTAFLPELERYWRAQGHAETSMKRLGQLSLAAEYFGDIPLTDYTPRMIAEWIEDMTERYAPATVCGKIGFLSSALAVAVRRGAAQANACAGIKRPKFDDGERPYVSVPQLEQLVALMPESLKDFVVLIGWTGLRRNEALLLEWKTVAKDFGMVWVRGKGGRVRRVPLAPAPASALRARHARAEGGDPRVFPDLTESRVNHGFRSACSGTEFEEWTPHYLRHGFCSRMVRAGNDLAVVQRIMGHKNISTTARYASWAPEGADVAAIEKLASMDPHLDAPRLAR